MRFSFKVDKMYCLIEGYNMCLWGAGENCELKKGGHCIANVGACAQLPVRGVPFHSRH